MATISISIAVKIGNATLALVVHSNYACTRGNILDWLDFNDIFSTRKTEIDVSDRQIIMGKVANLANGDVAAICEQTGLICHQAAVAVSIEVHLERFPPKWKPVRRKKAR